MKEHIGIGGFNEGLANIVQMCLSMSPKRIDASEMRKLLEIVN